MSLPENLATFKWSSLVSQVHPSAAAARRRGDLPSAGLLDAGRKGLAANPAEAEVSDSLLGVGA